MKSLDNKLIIYDSNCKVCSSLRNVVVRFTDIPEEKIKAFRDLTPDLSERVDPNEFKNVMALIDTSGENTIYGAEGIAYIFSSEYKIIDFFLRSRRVFTLFNFFYKTQAYNRYIIATPKSKFECNCYPDRILKYRISYIVITLLIAVFLTAMFGLSLQNFFTGISPWEAVLQMLLVAGSGWILQIIAATAILRDKALDYMGHLGSIMVAGLLILVPWMLFDAAGGMNNPYLPGISVVISSLTMLYLHIHRARYLQISQGWTLSWFILLQSTALFWIYFFHLK
jgi:hypothetical protein